MMKRPRVTNTEILTADILLLIANVMIPLSNHLTTMAAAYEQNDSTATMGLK